MVEDIGQVDQDISTAATTAVLDVLTDEQLEHSFDVLFSVALFNALLLPTGLLVWKSWHGFETSYDLILWGGGTLWSSGVWGIFLYTFFLTPANILSIVIPFATSAIITWPLAFFAFQNQPEFSLKSEQSLVFLAFTELEMTSIYQILKHLARADKFVNDRFFDQIETEQINDAS